MAIITISRGTFSGGKRLAACLGATLGYRVISREVLVAAAERYGVREETLVKGIESPPTFWERFSVDRQKYLAAITAALCREALADNMVYHGHAGHLLLAGIAHVLRVRVIAPMATRRTEAMAAHGLEAKEAEAYIRARDAERVAWTKFLYNVDWHDASLYDLVVNLEKIPLESACLTIAAVADRPEFRATPSSTQALADLFLVNHVRASLFLDPEVGATAALVEVAARQGVVTLAGILPSARQHAAVLAAVRALPEVTSVRAELLGARA
jgi:cytidylate kinase